MLASEVEGEHKPDVSINISSSDLAGVLKVGHDEDEDDDGDVEDDDDEDDEDEDDQHQHLQQQPRWRPQGWSGQRMVDE